MPLPKILEASTRHPAPAYLLYGPPNAGKRVAAEEFICQLLGIDALAAHPDLAVLDVEEGKKQISVDRVRELKERVSLRPAVAPRVIGYIPHADRLNESGSNALLKVLEEPPAGAVFVLVAEDPSRLPATLRSRVVQVPFRTPPALSGEEGETGSWADDLLAAKMLGARLRVIDELAKRCESDDDPERAWRGTLIASMGNFFSSRGEPERIIFGIALITALRFVGSPVSPRIALEAGAARMSANAEREAKNLLPTHVPRALPPLFADLVY